jgi:hypothetical protein
MESGSLGFLQVLTEVEILMLIFSFFTHLSNLVDLWIMQLMLWQELKTQWWMKHTWNLLRSKPNRQKAKQNRIKSSLDRGVHRFWVTN